MKKEINSTLRPKKKSDFSIGLFYILHVQFLKQHDDVIN